MIAITKRNCGLLRVLRSALLFTSPAKVAEYKVESQLEEINA
jgi:hypothetical protein